jgi:hypothetical protein
MTREAVCSATISDVVIDLDLKDQAPVYLLVGCIPQDDSDRSDSVYKCMRP